MPKHPVFLCKPSQAQQTPSAVDTPSHQEETVRVNRRIFTASAVAFACAPSLRANTVTARRYSNTIAVYRHVLNRSCACCNSQDEIAVIDELPSLPPLPQLTSTAFTPMQRLTLPEAKVPYLCPPTDQVTNAQELLRDLAAQYTLPLQRIDTELTLATKHMFVSSAEKRQLMHFHPQSQVLNQQILDEARSVPNQLKRRFEHAGTMYSVSPVGFNQAATMAVVWIGSSGGGCSDQQWQVLQRLPDGWKQLPWNSYRVLMCS